MTDSTKRYARAKGSEKKDYVPKQTIVLEQKQEIWPDKLGNVFGLFPKDLFRETNRKCLREELVAEPKQELELLIFDKDNFCCYGGGN